MGVCANERVSQAELDIVLDLCSGFSKAEMIDEKLMDVVTAVSGSSPAYVFMFIEAMADAAVSQGMPRKQAYKFASQTVLGSAKMVLETGRHPAQLRDEVTSPGGTTIAGIYAMEKRGLRAALIDGVKACLDKSDEMSRKK